MVVCGDELRERVERLERRRVQRLVAIVVSLIVRELSCVLQWLLSRIIAHRDCRVSVSRGPAEGSSKFWRKSKFGFTCPCHSSALQLAELFVRVSPPPHTPLPHYINISTPP